LPPAPGPSPSAKRSTCSRPSCRPPTRASGPRRTLRGGSARRGCRDEPRSGRAPVTVEALRAAVDLRDATLLSVLAYAGLRPGEALALRWDDIREKTILVERALSLGADEDTKTTTHRTVRLVAPLRQDLAQWRLASGRPDDGSLVFPSQSGGPWTEPAYQSWRRRSFKRALDATGVTKATPYTLRHSFASLLLDEGRSVIYVARQLGHDARLTLSRYGHVIDEFEDQPNVSAETSIREARVPSEFPIGRNEGNTPADPERKKPREHGASWPMELAGLEPATSWVRSRRSPN
jgi:integrase